MSSKTSSKQQWLLEFDKVFSLSCEGRFLPYIEKLKGQKQVSFWSDWFPSAISCSSFSEREWLLILKCYFTSSVASESFLKKFAEQYPEILVVAIRFTYGFHKDNHFSSFDFFKDSNLQVLRDNYHTFSILRNIESKLFAAVEVRTKSLVCDSIEELLWMSTLWYEIHVNNEAQSNPDSNVFEIRLGTLSLFLESTLLYSKLNVQVDQNVSISEMLCHPKYQQKLRSYWDVLDAWMNWYWFKITIWDTYCWDMNFKSVLDGNDLKFVPESMREHENWKRKESFYHLLQERFQHKARTEFRKLIKEDGVFEDKEYLAALAYAKELQSFSFNSTSIEKVLNGFEQLRDISNKWFHETSQRANELEELAPAIAFVSNELGLPPYQVFEHNASPIDNRLASDEIKDCLNAICSTVQGRFDRFRPKVKLSSRPLIEVQGKYILLHGILTRHERVFTVSEAILSNKLNNRAVRNLGTDEMEFFLASKLSALNNFECLFGNRIWGDSRDYSGDIDVAWLIDDVLYIFQLKRSMLRLTLEDAFYERLESSEKAIVQLQKAIVTIGTNPELIEEKIGRSLKGMTIVPMVVHTSFECSAEQIDGISIVNYHEMLEELESTSGAIEFKQWLDAKNNNPCLPFRKVSDEEERIYLESKTINLTNLNSRLSST